MSLLYFNQVPTVELGHEAVEELAAAGGVERRPAGDEVDAHEVGEHGVDVEIVEGRELGRLVPAQQVDAVLLFEEVLLVARGGEQRIEPCQLAAQTEVRRRAAAQLFDDFASADGRLLDGAAQRACREGGRDVAQRAVELGPCAQEAAPRAGAEGVVGPEEGRFEPLCGVCLLYTSPSPRDI